MLWLGYPAEVLQTHEAVTLVPGIPRMQAKLDSCQQELDKITPTEPSEFASLGKELN